MPIVRYANPGIAREMSTANLNSGQPYQRPVRPGDVNTLIRRWYPAYLSPIEVSFRDGNYNVINAQHQVYKSKDHHQNYAGSRRLCRRLRFLSS